MKKLSRLFVEELEVRLVPVTPQSQAVLLWSLSGDSGNWSDLENWRNLDQTPATALPNAQTVVKFQSDDSLQVCNLDGNVTVLGMDLATSFAGTIRTHEYRLMLQSTSTQSEISE